MTAREIVLISALSSNFIAEVVSLILIVLVLFFMVQSKPKPTGNYRINFIGVLLSISTIVLQLAMSIFVRLARDEYEWIARVEILLFLFSYCGILICIYVYLDNITHKQIINKKKRKIILYVFGTVYLLCSIRTITIPNLIRINGNDISFAYFTYFFLYLGIIAALMVLLSAISNKKMLPRSIYNYIWLFALLDIFLLIAQLLFKEIIFTSLTYVFPFTIFYILFHSNPIDENSGCRNEYSMENQLKHAKRWNKKLNIINVYLPLNKNTDSSDIELYLYIVANVCRKVERLDPSIEIYTKNAYTYNVLVKDRGVAHLEKLIMELDIILSEIYTIKNAKFRITHKIIVLKNDDFLDSSKKINQFIKLLDKKYIKANSENETYVVRDEDYIDFKKHENIVETFSEIRNSGRLDDDRIICYAQPIYDVKSGKFKTAEALMRLNINGEMLYPDMFIPIAEDNNFIHTLTLIMIKKVCKVIKELEKNYYFDAITINSSTFELDDIKFSEEILLIIEENDVNPAKIRIEITESNMVYSYKNIVANMNMLKEAGVYFYLDDFGTGYSNLERIFGCPFKTIKFDKSVLYTAMKDSAMDDIMCSMINAFRKKGFNVLVEGVEDEKMRDKCIESGFEFLQGYYYSKPIPIENLTEFFDKK